MLKVKEFSLLYELFTLFFRHLTIMKTHRFFVTEDIKENTLFRSEDTDLVHQLRDVFRMKKDDSIVLFDGSGYEFPATITLLTKKEVECQVGEGIQKEDKGSGVHLYMSIIKKDKLELVYEKATELGVASITPVIAERSQYDKVRLDRLGKIVREAAEQCGRVTLPELHDATPLTEILSNNSDMTVLDMAPVRTGGSEEPTSNGVQNDLRGVTKILVGPEGGWSDAERQLFKEKGMNICSLPFDTLRAETAAVTGLVLAA